MGSQFTAARMVPACCRLFVIFQVDAAVRLAPGIETMDLPDSVGVELRASEELPVLELAPDQDVIINEVLPVSGNMQEHRIVVRMCRANIVDMDAAVKPAACTSHSGQRVVLLDGPGGVGPVQMPRVTQSEFRMRTKRPRRKSALASFKVETEAVLKECLRLDWSRAKINRIVPEGERLAVLEVLARHYRRILAIYRWLSVLGGSESAFTVNPFDL